MSAPLFASEQVVPACPVCGLSQVDFAKTGKLGCHHCYETFEYPISTLLVRMHPSVIHRGKIPLRYRSRLEIQKRIEALESRLEEAVQIEAFEVAAQIQDELAPLQAQIQERRPYGIGDQGNSKSALKA